MDIKEAQEGISNHVKDLIEVCPHCDTQAHIEALWNDYHRLKNRDVEFYVIFRCKPCRKLLLKTFYFKQNEHSRNELLSMKGWTDMFPVSLDDKLSNEEKAFIPSEVCQDYNEALRCQAIGADRAACAMFRRALQSALVKLGADPKIDLIKQIGSLSTVSEDVKDWSHQIRIFGNWGAHPDKDNLKNVDHDDVIEVHDFTSKFLMYSFIMPEKVKLSRERREKKIKGDKDSSSRVPGA
ncbi:DUF4145 domain-containing protein [Immundisolibacter sp.]|uniref:DUF4145 domain-containing protein n=1 Tax=Immundisolibacter sp. TaxID=1934948 RepID=UPI003561C0CC